MSTPVVALRCRLAALLLTAAVLVGAATAQSECTSLQRAVWGIEGLQLPANQCLSSFLMC